MILFNKVVDAIKNISNCDLSRSWRGFPYQNHVKYSAGPISVNSVRPVIEPFFSILHSE